MPSSKSSGRQIKKTKKRKAGDNTEGIPANMDGQATESKGVDIGPNNDSEIVDFEKKIVLKFGKKIKMTLTQEISEVQQKELELEVSLENKTVPGNDTIPSQAERSRSSEEVPCQNSVTNSGSSLDESSNKDHKQLQSNKSKTVDDMENMKNSKGDKMDEEALTTEHKSTKSLNVPKDDVNIERSQSEIPATNESLSMEKDDSHLDNDKEKESDAGFHGNEIDSGSHGNQSDVIAATSDTSKNLKQSKTESHCNKDEVIGSKCSQESQVFEVHDDCEVQNEPIDYITNSTNVKDDSDIPTTDENAVTMATSDSDIVGIIGSDIPTTDENAVTMATTDSDVVGIIGSDIPMTDENAVTMATGNSDVVVLIGYDIPTTDENAVTMATSDSDVAIIGSDIPMTDENAVTMATSNSDVAIIGSDIPMTDENAVTMATSDSDVAIIGSDIPMTDENAVTMATGNSDVVVLIGYDIPTTDENAVTMATSDSDVAIIGSDIPMTDENAVTMATSNSDVATIGSDIPTTDKNAVTMATTDSDVVAIYGSDVNTACSDLATVSYSVTTATIHSMTNQTKEMLNVTNNIDEYHDDLTNKRDGIHDDVTNQSVGMHDGLTNQSDGIYDGLTNQNDGIHNGVANQSNGIHDGVANQSDGKQDGLTNQSDGIHDGLTNQSDIVTSNIMDISAGGDTFSSDMNDKDRIVTAGGDFIGSKLTKEYCDVDVFIAEDLHVDKDCNVVKDERNINSDTNVQSISSENQKMGKVVESTNDEMTDSQLCALDWTVSEEEKTPSRPTSKSWNSHNTPVQEVRNLPLLPSGTTVVKGLIQQLSQLNMMILRTKREMESYRRQRGQKQQRRPIQTNIHNNLYK